MYLRKAADDHLCRAQELEQIQAEQAIFAVTYTIRDIRWSGKWNIWSQKIKSLI